MSGLYHQALATGMREGELLELKWSAIDWRKNTLRVERQVQRVPGQGLVIAPPKTEAGNRIIALGASTLRKLSDHRVLQEQLRLEVGDTWIDNWLIFPSSIGTPLDPRNLLRDFKIVLERAGLPDMRFHDIRHSSITLLLNEVGAPIKEAQHRAGHTRPSTTMDIYGDKVSSKLDSAMTEGLDDLITPVKVTIVSKKKIDVK
jgi:integrase